MTESMDVFGLNDCLFHEQQRFSRWLRWFFAADAVFLTLLVLFILSYTMGSDEPLPVIVIAIVMFIPIAVGVLFWSCCLETQVRSDGLYIKYFPFHLDYKKFAFEEISEYYPREYRPIREYGGWGIRWGKSAGKAYNICGNKGLQLILKDGKKVLIGSQMPEEFAAAIDRIRQ